jgi:hypothetical protein
VSCIRSNFSGIMQVDVTGGPGDTGFPLSFCCWCRVRGGTGGYGSILILQDNFFNSAPGFIRNAGGPDLAFTTAPGTNLSIVDDPTQWCFLGMSWAGTGSTAFACALDHNGKWTFVSGVAAGVGDPPSIFIGGRTIGGGTTAQDADVEYRGVHIWEQAIGVPALMQQSRQLAPVNEQNLWSTTYFYDLSTAQLGQSVVGRKWSSSGGWTTDQDAPPRPSKSR